MIPDNTGSTAGSDPKGLSVFILSVSSDIGEQLAQRYLDAGSTVYGTYRTGIPDSLQGRPRLHLLGCDIRQRDVYGQLRGFMRDLNARWDVFISCVGILSPVGPFFGTEIEAWIESAEVNSLAQLRCLHALHPFRSPEGMAHVVFFAGGGTNGAFPNYSAYCLGKIGLIKMCELLDDENADLNCFIVGTGWVRTKIHRQTLAAGEMAGANLERTIRVMEGVDEGDAHGDIYDMITWGIAQGKAVVGGRNFSLVNDAWRDGGAILASSLRSDVSKYKLRRHGNTQ